MTSDPAVQSDAPLLTQFARQGEQRAFQQLVQRHMPLVLGVCRTVLGRHHDAEDAAQATFLTLARKASSLCNRNTLAGWLHRVAWNVSMRAREARDLRNRRERDSATRLMTPSSCGPSNAASENSELHAAINRLPEKYRIPLILHHLEGWSELETAQLLNLRLGTLSGRLSRGREMLKNRLAPTRSAHNKFEDAALAGLSGGKFGVSSLDVSADEVSRSSAAVAAAVADGAYVSPTALGMCDGALRTIRRARCRFAACFAGMTVGILGVVLVIAVQRGVRFPGQASGPISGPITGMVTGQVRDPSDRPVRGAHLAIFRDAAGEARGEKPLATGYSAADGRFVISELPFQNRYFVLCTVTLPRPRSDDRNYRTEMQSNRAIDVVIRLRE